MFYFSGFLRELVPDVLYRLALPNIIDHISKTADAQFLSRLHYYNKLQPETRLSSDTPALGLLTLPKKGRAYYLDARQHSRYFYPGMQAAFMFGDYTTVPENPAFIKSRPIHTENQNAVILKLNKVRHYAFVHDPVPFEKKIPRLIGRAEVKQLNRIDFYQKYFNHPLMDLGQINKGTSHDEWIKPRLSIPDHLSYKYVLCLEGFDIATNLKWVMSSGSLAVMPPPSNESWFMEGKLIPDHHYVAIRPDFSDVVERLEYFNSHPDHARQIIKNANQWVEQFMNTENEFHLGIAVMLKYFECTGQLESLPNSGIPDFLHVRS